MAKNVVLREEMVNLIKPALPRGWVIQGTPVTNSPTKPTVEVLFQSIRRLDAAPQTARETLWTATLIEPTQSADATAEDSILDHSIEFLSVIDGLEGITWTGDMDRTLWNGTNPSTSVSLSLPFATLIKE